MFLQKARRCRDSSSSVLLLRYNTHAFWRTTLTIQANVDHHIVYSDTNLVLGKILVHSVEKTHGLVVTVELIWLLFYNIFSFNFVQTPNKSLRFTRFSRSYIHSLLSFQATALKVVLLVFSWCVLFKMTTSLFFGGCLPPTKAYLRNLSLFSTPVAWMFLTPK